MFVWFQPETTCAEFSSQGKSLSKCPAGTTPISAKDVKSTQKCKGTLDCSEKCCIKDPTPPATRSCEDFWSLVGCTGSQNQPQKGAAAQRCTSEQDCVQKCCEKQVCKSTVSFLLLSTELICHVLLSRSILARHSCSLEPPVLLAPSLKWLPLSRKHAPVDSVKASAASMSVLPQAQSHRTAHQARL